VISSNTCGTSLAVHASCVVNLEFAPTAPAFPPLPAPEPGTLNVADNARFSPQRVYLSGTVVQGGSNQTMTTLTSSLNPATSGQPITFTAAVAGTTTNTPLPTGSVTFMDGTTTLGTGTLNGSAQATFTTSSLSSGSQAITAVYGSDANYATSTSAVLTEVVNGPAIVGTTTTLIGSPNPAAVGQTVTLTATVAEVGGSGVPTGTVTFYDGTTSLGTGTLSSGMATYSTSSLAVGTHSITANYGGDMSNAASTSSAVTVTVTVAAAPDFSLALSPTSGTVSQGSTITSTITITPAEGFNQSVSFACSGLPANTSCNFSPISVTPSGTAASTSTLTITTDVTAASVTTKPLRTPGGVTSLAMLAGGGSLGLLLLRRRRKDPRLWLLQMGLVAAFVFTSAMIGCGRGASATTKTPTGTSQITVTATAGSMVHTATYSLTVQ
jgi:Bacterial Ig-like domain (group 3)